MTPTPSRILSRTCTFVGLALLPLPGVCAAPDTAHYGMYLNRQKIGWMKTRVERVTGDEGERVRISSESVVEMELMGTRVRQETSMLTLCDANLRPLTQEFRILSGGSEMGLRAQYGPDRVAVELENQGSTTKKTLPIPKDGSIVADSSLLTLGGTPKAGTRQAVYYLNPITVAFERAVVTVEGRRRVRYAGVEREATVISATTPLGTVRSWEDPPGEILWAELPLGMKLFRMSEEESLRADAAAPEHDSGGIRSETGTPASRDLAELTAVRADREIPRPRQVRELVLELAGLPDRKFAVADARQRATPRRDTDGVWVISIHARARPTQDRPLPIRAPALKPYLAKDALLDTDAPQIRRLAETLRDPKSAVRTANRVREWIHRNLQPDFGIGVPRSAVDVLNRRRGVCRDYAVLFAAIARAAGVPTRLVSGIVYSEGKFYYHAWVECWTGEWHAWDPTLPQDFVDATHVKLAQGNASAMYGVYEVVGKLRARVIRWSH